jgi:N-acetylmuramoyl-L-alanine amidase
MKKNKIIILDNGHGQETPGKRSPDGLFREYAWTRNFVKQLKCELEHFGYTVIELVPEDNDISLYERVNRVNDLCKLHDCVLVSIHNNAAGNGKKWYNVTGWEAYTSPGNTRSDLLAELLYEEIENEGIKLRTDFSDKDSDKEGNFTIIKKTICPAVLTENMFMDSKKDIEFLNSEVGMNKLLKAHVGGLRRYLEDPDGPRNSWLMDNIGWDEYWSQKTQINKCIYK